jgi:hypothetical protein
MEPCRENNYGCPDEIVDTIKQYVEHRLEPGSFVRAVLENDLMSAIFKAHPLMLPHLKYVCMYVWWEIPSECWGSREKVNAWLKRKDAK